MDDSECALLSILEKDQSGYCVETRWKVEKDENKEARQCALSIVYATGDEIGVGSFQKNV